MSIETRLMGMTSDEITQVITELEKEQNSQEKNIDTIESEISRIDREILKLRERKKDLEETARKGRQIVREKRLDIKIATRMYWQSRGH